MKSIKSITLAVSGLFLLPALAYADNSVADKTASAMMQLNTSVFTLADLPKHGGDLWAVLRQDFRMNEVNQSLVRSHESKFSSGKAYFNRTIQRSKPYMYHIATEVKKRGMPAEIALLPFIESAYVTKAKSHVGASGLWQFMPATGRHFGLEQTPLYDGRHDVYAATDAALNYLQYLHGLFGDWSLALAAYNWGEGNMSRAIRRAQAAGLPPTYENLKMPNETRNYVPKLLAVRNLVNNPQAFGLTLPEMKHEPYFRTVTVNGPLDIMAAAHLANISENEFLALNPAFKTPVFIPKGNRKMLLPVAAAQTFERNYRESDSKNLLSWDIYTAQSSTALADLANMTGMSVSELKRLNGISGTHIAAGRSLLVSKNSTKNGLNSFAKADFDPVPDKYNEQAPVLTAQQTVRTPPPAPVSVGTPFLADAAKAQDKPHVALAPPANVTAAAVLAKQPEKTAPPVTALAAAQTDKTASPAAVTAFRQPEKPAVNANAVAALADKQPAALTQSFAAAASAVKQPSEPTSVQTAQTRPQAAAEQPEKTAATARETPADTVSGRQPETAHTAANQSNTFAAEDPTDELMALALASQERLRRQQEQAAQAVQQTAAAAEAKEQKEQSERRIAEAKQRQQQQQLAKAKAAQEAEKAKAAETSRALAANTGTHKVGSGETLYSIAKRYNMSVADLAAANHIKGEHIQAGQTLKVSLAAAKNAAPAAQAVKTVAKGGKAAEAKPSVPASYTVRKGDTLHAIAARYNLKLSEIKKLNHGNDNIKAGQTIRLTAS